MTTMLKYEILSPKPIATEPFTEASAAVARLEEIYERNTGFLRDRFEAYANGEPLAARMRATYPFVRIRTDTYARLDSRLSYGFVSGPGVHETTITRADLFRAYFTEQIGLLVQNHGVPVEIGESDEPIPIHFAYRRDINIEASFALRDRSPSDRPLRDLFDTPDLATMDDAIVNGTLNLSPGTPAPLAMFRAARVDYSLHRLYHYTGTDPGHFQNFVIFTNYQFYVDAFARSCREQLASNGRSGLRCLCRAGQHHYAQRAPRRLRADRFTPRAHAADAGLSSSRARLSGRHNDQHWHRPFQCPYHNRPRCRAAAPHLANVRTLCGA